MEKGQFPLVKWQPNIQALNDNSEKNDTKLLGINWNKKRDTYALDVSSEVHTKVTQRAIVKKLASIYDPLGLFHLHWLMVNTCIDWQLTKRKDGIVK